jgi:AcrR family transcriptional regulator
VGRPRAHDDTTREALLRAAEDQLGRGQPLSVRGIAEAVATTTRAVYSLFGSMDGLQRALIARGFQMIQRRVEQLPVTADPVADLLRAGLEFRAFAIERPNLFRLNFEHMLPAIEPTPQIQQIQRTALLALHARVARCCDAGLFGRREALAVTWQFHSFCQGLASVELSGWLPDRQQPERLWRDALTAFTAGLADTPRAATPPRSATSR